MTSTIVPKEQPIILLDLNYTLADNSRDVIREGRFYNVAVEQYRGWLIEMLDGFRVVLITVRPQRLKADTMARIMAETGWQPDEAYFNEWGLKAPECKRKVVESYVFPKHGRPGPTTYLALESNDETAKMYASFDISRYRALEVKGRPHLLFDPEQPSQPLLF